MAAEYSCILRELLGDGWVRLRGEGERRGEGVGRLIEGGGVGRGGRGGETGWKKSPDFRSP